MPSDDRTIETAQRLMMQGHLIEAERLYRDLLAKAPDDLFALEGLGVVLYQQERGEEAADIFARGVAIDPRSVRFQANLGEALRTVRRFDEARDHLDKAVAIDPKNVPAWNSVGLLAFGLGQYNVAERAYRLAIRLDPRFVRAQVNLAATLLALGRSGEASDALRAALRIEPNNPMALVNLANLLSDSDDRSRLPEAETISRLGVALSPRSPRSLLTLARVLRLQGKLEEALDHEARARKLAPGLRPGSRPEAESAERGVPRGEGTAAKSSEAQARYAQGMAHLTGGRLQQAERCMRVAIELDATISSPWVALATIQAERGDIGLSCESARTALTLSPGQAEAYWRLATNLLGQLPDEEIRAMERLVGIDSLSNDDRASLHFGLAAVFDRVGRYARAAAELASANSHQAAANFARGLAFNPDQHSAFIDKMIATMTADFLACRKGWGDTDVRPVFVVGFPRSGTTLTEQILASHPGIRGAGELPDIKRIFDALPAIVGRTAGDGFEALHMLDPIAVKAAGRRYLDKLDTLAPAGAARVVDKMPDNVNFLGLIAILFPNAKVIICYRDPRDVAVSCWQTGFRSCSWNNDWNHIARRLADYQRIVKHWERVDPLPRLNLYYEDMVAGLEHQARRLIEFVGLPWDPSCVEFHSNRRVVRTPSFAQVRRPVHSRSVGRWRSYEPYLQTLLEALNHHGVNVDSEPGRRA
jgi:tetratricopeptide (TPR) repeat protein